MRLRELGVELIHGDMRTASDLEALPAADWVIDAAANPSVLAGVRGHSSSRQLFEHNLASLVNVLEYCREAQGRLVAAEQQPGVLDSGAGRAAAQDGRRRV